MMSQRFFRTIAPLLALSIGCRGHAPAQDDRFRLTLAPATFSERVSLQQSVHVESPQGGADFEAVLDISPETLTLIGLKFGQRIFTLSYDGSHIEESRSVFMPREVQARDILADIQLALWPAPAIRAALPVGWTLSDSAAVRVLAHDGQDITTVTYTGSPKWIGEIVLSNHEFKYKLDIRSIAAPP